jgi:hypothetical protein
LNSLPAPPMLPPQSGHTAIQNGPISPLNSPQLQLTSLQQLSESATTSITTGSPAINQLHHHSETVVTLVFAIIHVLGCAAALLSTGPAVAQAQLPSSIRSEAAPVLVIGFMGGFVRTDDFHHSEFKLRSSSR